MWEESSDEKQATEEDLEASEGAVSRVAARRSERQRAAYRDGRKARDAHQGHALMSKTLERALVSAKKAEARAARILAHETLVSRLRDATALARARSEERRVGEEGRRGGRAGDGREDSM